MDKRLNELLRDGSGAPITERAGWLRRAGEYRALIEQCMLGHAPRGERAQGEVISRREALQGAALHEIVRICYGPGKAYSFLAHVLRPNRAGRFPVITWNVFTTGYQCPRAQDAIARGYVIALFDKEQLFHDERTHRCDAALAYPGYDWGAIRIWAWGHSRLIDFLEDQPYVDADRFVATGHSRGGKAALAAGAYDARIAVTAPINSGCGGAGCFRVLGDRYGENGDARREESLGRIAAVFPHWWTPGFIEYGNAQPPYMPLNESTLPFDLHAFKALIAPRALLTIEGLDDAWANPYGTYLTWRAAQPVFDIMGAPDNNAVYYREGGHAFGDLDWRCLLDFCDWRFYGRGTPYWNNGERYFDRFE